MIFVANGADASANNLGKVSIKTIEDVSQETYDVIKAYGNKSFTDDQIIAIDDFLVQLKNLSTYSRFTYFILPILSPATEKGDMGSDTIWTDTNPCYDIISKQRYSADGFNGYVDKHGLRCYKNSSNTARVLVKNGIQVNCINLTVGVCMINNNPDFFAGVSRNQATFGASDKQVSITFKTEIANNIIPIVTTFSRTNSEAHGVRNGEIGTVSVFSSEHYLGQTYTLRKLLESIFSDSENDGNVVSFMFLCSGYGMTEQELIDINNICLNLMKALW